MAVLATHWRDGNTLCDSRPPVKTANTTLPVSGNQ